MSQLSKIKGALARIIPLDVRPGSRELVQAFLNDQRIGFQEAVQVLAQNGRVRPSDSSLVEEHKIMIESEFFSVEFVY